MIIVIIFKRASIIIMAFICNIAPGLTISVRQAGVAAQSAVTLEMVNRGADTKFL